jgi:outer membrane receptor for ferrienterochelin and colicin
MRGRNVSEGSLFADLAWTRGAWTIEGGSRYTKNERFGSNLSSSAAAAFAITPGSALQASLRQSYRAPSLFELYFQTATNSVYGNLELRPETSSSADLGYVYSAGPLNGRVSVYRAVYDDKIVRVRRLPDNPADRSLIYQNGNRFRTSGVELDLHYALAARASAMLAWTWTEGDKDSVSRLWFAPAHRVTGGISVAPAPRVDLSTLVTYRSGVDGPLEPIGAQATIDLNGTWTQTAGPIVVRHELSLRNVADERITYPEYVRGVLNAIDDSHGRTLQYMARFTWKR